MKEYFVSPRRKDLGGPADRQDRQTDCGCRQIYRLAQTKDAEFRKTKKLSMIIPRLEQWYGRKVMCQKDLADKYRFTF